MTSLKELTDIQLERKLTRLYDLGKDKEISLIEDEQKLRYSNWEKCMLKDITELVQETSKGSAIDRVKFLSENNRCMGGIEIAKILNLNVNYVYKLLRKLYT